MRGNKTYRSAKSSQKLRRSVPKNERDSKQKAREEPSDPASELRKIADESNLKREQISSYPNSKPGGFS